MKNIFISSTFIDMQAERDLVQERVLPALREEARKYGENVGVIDLRWGVDTSTLETEEGAMKVLQVCLDEIDRSHPYMLIFLGERYGTVMRGDLIEDSVCGREDKYTTEDYMKSITALEVEYGALSEKYGELNHCVVCFREPVVHTLDGVEKDLYAEHTEAGKRKLEALKERIKRDLGEDDRLINYTCTWDKFARRLVDFRTGERPLEDVLIERIRELFCEEWEYYGNLSWFEKDRLQVKAQQESVLMGFVGRETVVAEYSDKMRSGKHVILEGESGSGKTSLLFKTEECLREEGQTFIVLCGTSENNKDYKGLIRNLCYYFETLTKKGDHKETEQLELKELEEYYFSLSKKITERVFIFIDAVERLGKKKIELAVGESKNIVYFVTRCRITLNEKRVCSGDELVISFRKDRDQDRKAYLSNAECIEVAQFAVWPLRKCEAEELICKGLKVQHRDAYKSIVVSIMNRFNIINPLYITIILERLKYISGDLLANANDEGKIIEVCRKCIDDIPDDVCEASYFVMRIIAKKIDEYCFVVLEYLAVAVGGLRKEDLLNIFQNNEALNVLNITRFLNLMNAFVYEDGSGLLKYRHDILKKAVLQGGVCPEEVGRIICEYIITLPKNDYLKATHGYEYAYKFRNTSLLKHLMLGGAIEGYIYEVNRFIDVVNKYGTEFLLQFIGEQMRVLGEIERRKLQNFFINLFGCGNKRRIDMRTSGWTIAVCSKLLSEYVQIEGDELFELYCLSFLGDEIRINSKLAAPFYKYEKKLFKKIVSKNADSRIYPYVVNYFGRWNKKNVLKYRLLAVVKESVKYWYVSMKGLINKKEKKSSKRTIENIMNERKSPFHYFIRDMKMRYMRKERLSSEFLQFVWVHMLRKEKVYEQMCKKDESINQEVLTCEKFNDDASQSKTLIKKMYKCIQSESDELWRLESAPVHELGRNYVELARFQMKQGLYDELQWTFERVSKLYGSGRRCDEEFINVVHLLCLEVVHGCKLLDSYQMHLCLVSFDKLIENLENIYTNNVDSKRCVLLGMICDRMASVLLEHNWREEALKYYEKCLLLTAKLSVENTDESTLNKMVYIYKKMGQVLCERGRICEAKNYYIKWIECKEKLLSGKDNCDCELACCFKEIGDIMRTVYAYPEAVIFYRKEIEERKRQCQAGNKKDIEALNEAYFALGKVLCEDGRIKEAESYFENFLKIDEERKVDGNGEARKLVNQKCEISNYLVLLNRVTSARRYCESALQEARRLCEESAHVLNGICLVKALLSSAEVYYADQCIRESEEMYLEAINHTRKMYEKAVSQEVAELLVWAIRGRYRCSMQQKSKTAEMLAEIEEELIEIYGRTEIKEAKELLEEVSKHR